MPFPGQPKDTPIPPKLDKWNWGAFMLNWIWGLGNSTYIALLMFVPLVNIIMFFVLGAKGSQWAWKNRLWEDEEHFIKTQRNWARAGLLIPVIFLLMWAPLFLALGSIMSNNDAYMMSLEKVQSDDRIIQAMGEPIEAGWFTTGSISTSGSKGKADLSIPISGSKCKGRIYSQSERRLGEWEVLLLVVKLDCNSKKLILIDKQKTNTI